MMLDKAYDRELFLEFVHDFLPGFTKDSREINGQSPQFSDARSLGECAGLDLRVLEIEVKGSLDKRVSITTDAFKLMKSTASYRSLVAFHAAGTDQWRLSLMTAQPTIENGKVITKLSSPKRYSYLLGPHAKTITPSKFLYKNGKVKDVDDLLSRFSVEVVNNDFYQELAKLYDKLVGTKDSKGLLSYSGSVEASHEFAVRLIGRIVFCWFLREKKSPRAVPLISHELLSLQSAKIEDYYHKVLAPLFFEVLNKPVGRRAGTFRSGEFGKVPYLNGGLFADQKEDYYKFDKLLGLSVPYGGLKVPDAWLKDFIALLEMYNFTVDENTSVDIDLSIDPEMLGRIFENLLARINPETGESVRKSTGSFYSPREIVDYMVDESLVDYLVRKTNIGEPKIRALISLNLSDDEKHPLSASERKELLICLSEVRILDPACGSGAFPIGALQKIVFMLQQIDPTSNMWLDIQLAGAPSELKKQLKEQSYDYVRKLGVIRKSIFGVDIQPIATEIARLRCFLTLIVDENVDDLAENRGVKVLPNLDFKFVTANTLVRPPSSGGDNPSLFNRFEDDLLVAIDDYFSAEGTERAELSHKIRDLIDEKVNENKSYVFNNYGIVKDKRFEDAFNKKNQSQNTKLIAEANKWDSYKNIFSHKLIEFFDVRYFFPSAASGFDIVIGNPPYIAALAAKKIIDPAIRSEYKKTYLSANGAYDMYLLFFERGINLLNNQGALCYISPTKYVSAKYAEAFRTSVGQKHLAKLAHFSNARVFESAGVSTFVSLFKKNRQSDIISTEIYDSSDFLNKKVITNSVASLTEFPEHIWGHLLCGNYDLLKKIYDESDLVSAIAEVNGSTTAAEADKYSDFIFASPNGESLKMVNTGTIGNFRPLWGLKAYSNKRAAILTPYLSLEVVGARRKAMYESPKIIISKLSKHLTAMVDDAGEFASSNTTFIYGLKDIEKLKIITLIINSKLMNFVYKTMFSGMNLLGSFQFQAPQIRLLPIFKGLETAPEYEELRKIANQIQSDFPDYARQIDKVVYSLYRLSPKEIKIIESS